MIRIKVVRASRLLLAATALLLAVAVAVAAFRYFGHGAAPASKNQSDSQMARAAAVFAAASLSPKRVVFGQPMENEHTDREAQGFTVEILATPEPAPPAQPTPAPAPRRVLIYHTHTHEAYEPVSGEEYQALEAWRTDDQAHSVVRVGEELARRLEDLGIEAVHDLTDHEPPQLGTAYTRSLETLLTYREQPFDLFIDLHRDAWDASMAQTRTVEVGGYPAARLMLLVGNGEGFAEKPDVQANLDFARRLTERLNRIAPGICRPVLVKTGRYNQHLNTPSVLVEAGDNRNTLSQALQAMDVLARALEQMFREEAPSAPAGS